MSLKYADRDPKRPYRVAVVVSRKVSKSAVVRNRIRRRIYEQVRLQADRIPPGRDLIITVFSEQAATTEAAKIAAMVADLLQKANAKPAISSQTPVNHGIVSQNKSKGN
jgi:ribonuclease P protein component